MAKTTGLNKNARLYSQLIFLLITLWIGIEFSIYYNYLISGGTEFYISRPPGVEGFLPISSLMNFYYWLQTGNISMIHPAGLFIFLAIIAISILFKKSFCSWVCPVGFLSESVGELGKKILGKNLRIPKILDYILRSVKYLLLIFFSYAIFSMTAESLGFFLESPYNVVADIKMLLFFTHMSAFTAYVLIFLVIASFFIFNFWCRFLCPYGALLGFMSLFSPFKIRRNSATCTDCRACSKVCPAKIEVHKLNVVRSDECMSCLICSDVCPVNSTLEYKAPKNKFRFNGKKLVYAIFLIYFGIIGFAMISGKWKSSVSDYEYMQRVQELNTLKYSHPTGFEK